MYLNKSYGLISRKIYCECQSRWQEEPTKTWRRTGKHSSAALSSSTHPDLSLRAMDGEGGWKDILLTCLPHGGPADILILGFRPREAALLGSLAKNLAGFWRETSSHLQTLCESPLKLTN
jgi:hypothetical protein